nr:hypothetical protein Iba_chr06cCG10530 [Ipomoea batatas]
MGQLSCTSVSNSPDSTSTFMSAMAFTRSTINPGLSTVSTQRVIEDKPYQAVPQGDPRSLGETLVLFPQSREISYNQEKPRQSAIQVTSTVADDAFGTIVLALNPNLSKDKT